MESTGAFLKPQKGDESFAAARCYSMRYWNYCPSVISVKVFLGLYPTRVVESQVPQAEIIRWENKKGVLVICSMCRERIYGEL